MRQKSEEKRQQILDTAATLFLEKGVDGVSMSEISAHLGGSKATLYNYFTSKEELFIEVMLNSAHMMCVKAFSTLDLDLPLREKLERFGTEYLNFILSKGMVRVRRMVLLQADKADIGREVYERGIKRGWGHVAEILSEAVARGELHDVDTWRAGMQFKALLDCELIDRRMLGVDDRVSTAKIAANVVAALDIFFQFYGVKGR